MPLRRIVTLAAFASLALPAQAYSATPVGNSHRAAFAVANPEIRPEESRSAQHPVLAHNAAGSTTLLVYKANPDQPRRNQLLGVPLNQRGLPRGTPFVIAEDTFGDAEAVAVAASPASGEYVVAWYQDDPPGAGGAMFGEIAARRVSSTGPVGPVIRVSDEATDPHGGQVEIAFDPVGNWVVAWTARFGLASARYGPDGQQLSGPALLPTDAEFSYEKGLSLSSDSAGYLLVYGGRERTEPYPNPYLPGRVYARRLDLNGAPAGDERIAAEADGLTSQTDIVRTSGGYLLLARLGSPVPSYDNPAPNRSRLWTRPLSVEGEPVGPLHPLSEAGALAAGRLIEGPSPHLLVILKSGLFAAPLTEAGTRNGRAALLSGDWGVRRRTQPTLGTGVYLPGAGRFLSAHTAYFPFGLRPTPEGGTEIFTRPFVSGDFRCRGRRVTMVGTQDPNRLFGNRRRDVILARGGRDRIRGGRSSDTLCAGAGPDLAFGGGGRDLLLGGAGPDRLVGGPGRDRLIGGPGVDRLER